MLIYKITNIINNKIYIGKTTKNLYERKKVHIRNAKIGRRSILYSAIRKHGVENFIFEILEKLETSSVEVLNERETYYIKLLNSHYENGEGYNMTFGGDGGFNKGTENLIKTAKDRKGKTYIEIYGEEKAIEIISKKKQHSSDKKDKNYIEIYGEEKAIEVINKKSKSLKSKWVEDINFRLKMTEINKNKAKSGKDHPFYGKTHTKETKKKISEKRKGKTYEDVMSLETSKRIKAKKSEQYKGSGNPFYKEIDIIKVFEEYIKNPNITIDDLCIIFSVSRPTLSKRIKEILNITNIQKLKQELGIEKFTLLLKEKYHELLHFKRE